MIRTKPIQGVSYNVPTSIDDISIGRFIEFRNIDPNNNLDLAHWIINAKPTFKDSDTIEMELTNLFALAEPALNEMYEFMNSKQKNDVPESIEVLGSHFKMKKGLLNDLPYWPYVIAKKIIIEEAKKDVFDPTDAYPRVLAHYLYNFTTGKEYTEKRAEEYIDVINDIPMKPAIQLGNFFLKKQQNLFPQSKSSLKAKSIRNTLRLV